MTTPDDTCSGRSLALGEDLIATASRQVHWLLIEQPGAWGPDALLESRLPSDVAHEIDRRCRDLGVRPLLIRRGPGGGEGPRRRWAYVTAGAESPRLAGGWFTEPGELLDVDLGGLVAGTVAGAAAWTGPLVAVCTHGRHDRCCADEGRPVARALRSAGVDVWECSHIGGDRFAANLVQFPHGLYHGRVDPEGAAAVVAAYEAGRIHPDGYRGRGAWPPAVQAAEILLRRRLDEWAVDALRLEAHDRRPGADAGPERHVVRFSVAGHGPHVVTVDVGEDPRPRLLSCGNDRPGRPRLVTPVSFE